MKKHGHHHVPAVIVLILLAGCSAQPEDTSTTPAPPPPTTLTLNDIDRYFLSLKKWAELSPAKPDHAGQPVGDPSKSTENGYECVSQDYDISKTPDELVMFSDKDADVLWPGALVQGQKFLDGKFEALPLAQLAPTRLTVDLSIPEPYVEVPSPTKANMQAAIGTLVKRAESTPVPTQASYHVTEAFSSQQSLLDMNLSAKYLGQQAKAALSFQSSQETHTVFAYFVQKMFTVSVPTPRTPSEYFAPGAITMDHIQDQAELGRIGPDNPPLYVSSVSYGRILLFRMTSTSSQTDMEAAISYAYDAKVAHGDASLEAKYKTILSSSDISVVPYGGPWESAAQLIRSANLKDYFSDKVPPLSTAPAISYKLSTLIDGSEARVAEATRYTQKTCQKVGPKAVKKNDTFTLQYIGGGDNRYLSVADWQQVGLAGKYPYPTLQSAPVTLQFRGGSETLTSGANIRFATQETTAQKRALPKPAELGRWSSKPFVFYDKPDSSIKQNWIFKKLGKAKHGDAIHYGDRISIYSQYAKQYLCNDAQSHFLRTKNAQCTWRIGPPK
ncbi:thiol-activated cytolysin family protein [Nitrogeniibacter aestuarii]|uniref:thiol-activated cytolysin family protein n=1 Tax=Nitrogeniibacter aestuarii TaxID=2815343 RepID=UPI001E3F856C|nr:thiol-activated cytolysin family protein [Nitrogeniibacter aestuarii]